MQNTRQSNVKSHILRQETCVPGFMFCSRMLSCYVWWVVITLLGKKGTVTKISYDL